MYFLATVMSSLTPCMIQHCLKLLLAPECIDYKAACDLHHIIHRHLFQATQLFLYPVQQENHCNREPDCTCSSWGHQHFFGFGAVRNPVEKTRKPEFKLKSWTTGEDLTLLYSWRKQFTQVFDVYLPIYPSGKKHRQATRLCKHFQVLKRSSQSSFPLVVCMSSSALLHVCIAL